MNNHELLREITEKALRRMAPERVIERSVRWASSAIDNPGEILLVGDEPIQTENREIHVLGSGKASAAMGLAMERVLGNRLTGGLILTPEGTSRDLERIELVAGSHPIPDESSVKATQRLLEYASSIQSGALVFYLISGGTSALLCKPAGNLTLGDLTQTHHRLLRSGADIHEMNVVRTALSSVKGGQLLGALAHVELVDLIVSDVPGDIFRSIGSGPTTAGNIELKRAELILQKRDVWDELPDRVREWLRSAPEKKVEQHPGTHRQVLVSSASKLAGEVASLCRERGIATEIREPSYNNTIDSVQRMMMDDIRKLATIIREESVNREESGSGEVSSNRKEFGDGTNALVWYGESSVNVTGSGKGGRNQELALRVALELDKYRGEADSVSITFASIGTDGIDGPTDAAGAIIDDQTVKRAREKGKDPARFLANNDSYHLFEVTGELVKTGPTGNNLMDLQIAFVRKRS